MKEFFSALERNVLRAIYFYDPEILKDYGKERLSLIYLLGCSVSENMNIEFDDLIKV